jgi:hypothetical protein
VVPYEYVRELLGFQKGALEKVDVPDGLLDGVDGVFWYTKHVHYTLVWI